MGSPRTFVLVSGANAGIGYEISKKLASENPSYHVFMGCRDLAKGQKAMSSLSGLSVEPVRLDVTSDSSISEAFDTILKSAGRLDALINNAGIGARALPESASFREQLTTILDTNTVGAACLTESMVPLLRKSENPRIIFVSSRLGSISKTLDPSVQFYRIDRPHYKASKAAMNMIMAHYAVKFKGEGFKVNACCPGFNATGITGGKGAHPSEGAIIVCRLATAGKDGETGTFTDREETFDW